jgi:hypothetical protein
VSPWPDDHLEVPWCKETLRAVSELDEPEVRRLLKTYEGADLNVSVFHGFTLLDYALDSEVVIHQESGMPGPAPATVSLLLVSSGADPYRVHRDETSSVDFARELRHMRFLEAIEES